MSNIEKLLTAAEKKAFVLLKDSLQKETPFAIIQAACRQVITAQGAREALDRDGLIVKDGKSNPIEHPAIAVEAQAQRNLMKLLERWVRQ